MKVLRHIRSKQRETWFEIMSDEQLKRCWDNTGVTKYRDQLLSRTLRSWIIKKLTIKS